MTDAEQRANLWAWAKRHGFRCGYGGAYERDSKTGQLERLIVHDDIVRLEVFCSDYTLRCPYYWHTIREGWLSEISVDPITDKMKGME